MKNERDDYYYKSNKSANFLPFLTTFLALVAFLAGLAAFLAGLAAFLAGLAALVAFLAGLDAFFAAAIFKNRINYLINEYIRAHNFYLKLISYKHMKST